VTEQPRKKEKSKLFSNVALRMLEKEIRNQRMKSITEISKPNRTSAAATTGRLFFLEASGGRILSVNADGSGRKVILNGCRVPDGVVVDLEAGHIYWTNMGIPSKNDGSIERADLDGKNRVTIVNEGATFTPKQLHLEKENGKLYWCDREGMRVMRANLDGSEIETLVDTSKGDARPGTDLTKWCVGITVDPDRGQIYWTQKGPDDAGKGRIFRAKIDIPKGETPADRTDIEVLFDGLPEPIDLEIDLKNRFIYWTDRGDPPRGNTVNRASIDADFSKHPTPDILLTHLMEGIGIALDFKGNRMFLTDLAGTIYSAKLDGTEKKPLLVAQGNLTGIAYAEVSNNTTDGG
jgi:sugar lactone lactonase YvrE